MIKYTQNQQGETMGKQEYENRIFSIFDNGFMQGEDIDRREKFRKNEIAEALIELCYSKGDKLEDAVEKMERLYALLVDGDVL